MYNTGHEPQPIFSSDGGMDDSHANRQNLSVSVDDFALTISNLQLERGAGKYICRSEVDGKTNERIYDLVVRGTEYRPVCIVIPSSSNVQFDQSCVYVGGGSTENPGPGFGLEDQK